MAKYEPIEMVKSYSGKICEHSDVYFAMCILRRKVIPCTRVKSVILAPNRLASKNWLVRRNSAKPVRL